MGFEILYDDSGKITVHMKGTTVLGKTIGAKETKKFEASCMVYWVEKTRNY